MQERNAETAVNGRASQDDLLHLVENRSAKAPGVYSVRLRDRIGKTARLKLPCRHHHHYHHDRRHSHTTISSISNITTNWNSIQAGRWG